MEKYVKRNKLGNLFGKRKERSVREEQERRLEKSRRRAFWGLQIKYTFAPILWLYGIVSAILVGLFLVNWFVYVSKADGEVAFLQQLQVLPLSLAFMVLVAGVQIVLIMGFERQGKNELAMSRVPLPAETKELIRWEYSFFVTVSAFFVYFLMLCVLVFIENVLEPETAYGMAELYPAFYRFLHLYRVYPVIRATEIPAFLVCIVAISVLAPSKGKDSGDILKGKPVMAGFALASFLFYCLIEEGNPVLDLFFMGIAGFSYVGEVIFSYQRRQKNDRAEVMERVE